MKKSLIALAVLAAAGAASAQSTVSLYGVVDAYAGTVKSALADSTKKSQNSINSSGLSNSRWGLMGSEDLGGGLKANFVLESGFNTDAGTQAVTATGIDGSTEARQFGRKATVGLSGDFGTVELGRNYTAYDSARSLVNNTGDTNASITNTVFAAGTVYDDAVAKSVVLKSRDYAGRTDNSVRFDSAVYNGFSGSVAYAFGENKSATDDARNTASLHAKYVNGPVAVAYAYQSEKAANGDTVKYNLVGGSYDFGAVKLNAGYIKNKGNDITVGAGQVGGGGAETTGYQVGISAPIGAVTLYAGYATAKNETAAGAEAEKRTGYDLAATYALSKRTTAYAAYMSADVKDSDREFKALAVGVRHAF